MSRSRAPRSRCSSSAGARATKCSTKARRPSLSSKTMTTELVGVRDVEVPAPVLRDHDADVAAGRPPTTPSSPSRAPKWRSLPIAPTALADFEHCGRRFELVHLLGLPEHARGAHGKAEAGALDARTQGTLAHMVLERLPAEAFGAAENDAAISRILGSAGVTSDHPQHGAIAARRACATLPRHGLRARHPRARCSARARSSVRARGRVGRGRPRSHAPRQHGYRRPVARRRGRRRRLQERARRRSGGLCVPARRLHAGGARARYPEAGRLRAGLAFLGAGSGEPTWRELPAEAAVRTRIAKLGGELVGARWSDAFPRVELAKCESIYCGFIGRCHPRRD